MFGAETTHRRNALDIMVVEDEHKLANAIAEGLLRNGYQVTVAYSGESALEHLRDHNFDLILLDIMLPRMGGLETLRELRRDGFKMPVLVLTSKGSVDDRVRGLDAGADDYLVKPFAFPEPLARVRALHRRATPTAASVLQLADLKMDVSGRIAKRGDQVIELTEREFDLLEYLLLNSGSVVSREMVARDVWKTTLRYTSMDNVIDVHIARIRRKVDDPWPVKLLHTVRGVGFVMRMEDPKEVTIRITHIRSRLTLWYVAIFGVLFAAYICTACFLQYWQLKQQLYHAEVQDMETVQGLLYFTVDGQLSLHEEYFNRPESRRLLDRLLEVLDSNGQVLFRNRKLDGNTLGNKLLPDEGVNGFSPRSLRLADGTPVLVISHVHVLQETPVLIRLAYSTEPLRLQSLHLLGLLTLVLPIALVAAGFAGYRFAIKVLDPLEKMASLTESITARRLNERIPVQMPMTNSATWRSSLTDFLSD
jgi:two-component system copper resistance phosphate regulon response regulator CusR